MSKLTKLLLTLLVTSTCFNVYFALAINKDNVLKENIFITAAHLPNIEKAIKLYEDKERDTAYYLRDDRHYTKIKNKVVVVESLGKCKVTSSYEGGFTIKANDYDLIVSGLSGTTVFDTKGNKIGFISSLLKNQEIDCKTLE